MVSSLSPSEIVKFEQIAKDWWNPAGKFKPLHDLNPTRIQYIIKQIEQNLGSLQNLEILDIGCGGGLVAEPLARLGANVTAIDASALNIEIAKLHAEKSNLKINYQQILAEDLEKTGKKYQAILALEIIEHVEDVGFFIQTCCNLLEPNGLLIFSTVNKTVKSFMQTIIAAEYILKWLPIGTHSWSKFLKPSDIYQHIDLTKIKLVDLSGLEYSPFSQNWTIGQDVSNNYFITFKAL